MYHISASLLAQDKQGQRSFSAVLLFEDFITF
jgi:hypothetical protein